MNPEIEITPDHTVRVNIYLMMTPEDLARFHLDSDLEECLRARLDEFYDPDGNVVQPYVLGIDVDEA